MKPKRFEELSGPTKAYVSLVIGAGSLTVGHSIQALVAGGTPWDWTVLALLTLISGSATVKLPGLPATISVSETFVFTSVLLFGTPAATLTVALDAFIISLWSYRKNDPLYKIVFNLFALPLTIWIASQVFFSLPDWEPWVSPMVPLAQSSESFQVTQLLLPLVVLAFVYFSLNSWLIAFAIALERNLSPVTIWRNNFALLSLNYFGGASVAALLVSYTRNIDFGYILLIVPLLFILYFTFSTSMGRVADANRHLSELNALYMSTIETLAMAIDAKDQITHGHIRRVQLYAVRLAQRMGVSDSQLIKAIEAAALLHDMGKLAVPEYILNKPGPLTPAEFERMKLHASVGADILSAVNFPYPVVPIVRHHHENWDGTGYPDGLSGTDIPIGARILSVVDCFDALTSDRPYRPKLANKDAIDILLARKGTMYDPLVVDAFIDLHSELAAEGSTIEDDSRYASVKIGPHAPLAIDSPGRPLDEISASSEEMLALLSLSHRLDPRLGVTNATDLIAKHIRRLIPFSLAILYIHRADTHTLVAAHAVGEDAGLTAGTTIELGERLSGWVAANRRTIRNSDPVLDLGDAVRAFSSRPRSCLSTSLVSGERLVGVLSLYSPIQNAFTEEHQRIAEVVAAHVSRLIEEAMQLDRAQSTTFRDKATGLPTLDHLRQVFAARSSVLAKPACMLIVTFPPAISESGATAEFDRVQAVATDAIRRNLRATDILFKQSTFEFGILLLRTAPETASLIESRIREALIADVLHPLQLTGNVRIGLAALSKEHISLDELVKSATSALQDIPFHPSRPDFDVIH